MTRSAVTPASHSMKRLPPSRKVGRIDQIGRVCSTRAPRAGLDLPSLRFDPLRLASLLEERAFDRLGTRGIPQTVDDLVEVRLRLEPDLGERPIDLLPSVEHTLGVGQLGFEARPFEGQALAAGTILAACALRRVDRRQGHHGKQNDQRADRASEHAHEGKERGRQPVATRHGLRARRADVFQELLRERGDRLGVFGAVRLTERGTSSAQ